MLQFATSRLFQAFFVVLAMSLLVFAGIHLVGNPVDILISPDADAAERIKMIAAFGLDKPFWQQYLLFLKNALAGDLGRSFAFSTPAVALILDRMPATMELAVTAIFLAVVLGVPLGLWAGMYPRSWAGKSIMTVSILGFSLPTFWVGLLLIMIFSVHFGWLPSSGRGVTKMLFGVPVSFLSFDGLKHLLLPSFSLALFNIALVIRLTRAGIQEALTQDYVKFARAKGLSHRRIVGVHILKNILIPVLTVVALQFGSVIAFAIVTETIFSWPGMGKLIIDSVRVLDRPVIVAYLMLIVVLFVFINLVVDILYSILDPRIQLVGKSK